MHADIQANRLNQVAEAARQYATIQVAGQEARRAGRDQAMRIVETAASFTILEMAYFCQQMASHLPSTGSICRELTIFTNRLQEAIERKEQ